MTDDEIARRYAADLQAQMNRPAAPPVVVPPPSPILETSPQGAGASQALLGPGAAIMAGPLGGGVQPPPPPGAPLSLNAHSSVIPQWKKPVDGEGESPVAPGPAHPAAPTEPAAPPGGMQLAMPTFVKGGWSPTARTTQYGLNGPMAQEAKASFIEGEKAGAGALDATAEAEEKKDKILGNYAGALANEADHNAANVADLTRRREQASERLISHLQQTQADIANQKVDPNKFFNDRGTFAKIIAAIGIGLGGYLQGQGKENPALGIVNAAIDRDIASQNKNIELKRLSADDEAKTLGLTKDEYKEKAIDAEARRHGQLEFAKQYVASELAKPENQDPVRRAKLLTMQEDFLGRQSKSAADLAKELDNKIVGSEHYSAGHYVYPGGSPQKLDQKLLVQGVDKDGKPITGYAATPEAQQKFNERNAAYDKYIDAGNREIDARRRKASSFPGSDEAKKADEDLSNASQDRVLYGAQSESVPVKLATLESIAKGENPHARGRLDWNPEAVDKSILQENEVARKKQGNLAAEYPIQRVNLGAAVDPTTGQIVTTANNTGQISQNIRSNPALSTFQPSGGGEIPRYAANASDAELRQFTGSHVLPRLQMQQTASKKGHKK